MTRAQGSAISEEAEQVFSGSAQLSQAPASLPVSPKRGHTRAPTVSEVGDYSSARDSGADLRAAFSGASAGPIQLGPEEGEEEEEESSPSVSPSASISPPARAEATSSTAEDLLLIAKTRQTSRGKELQMEGGSEEEALPVQRTTTLPPHVHPVDAHPSWYCRVLKKLQKPMLPYIDQSFWTVYEEDPKTGTLQAVAVPDVHTLTFGQTLWRCLLSNTQWVCFFFYFLNLMLNGNLLALVVPVLILTYAIFERPRVARGFWLFALLWSSIVVAAKFVFQLYIFCTAIDTSAGSAGVVQLDRKYIFQPSPYCVGTGASDSYSIDAIFGLRKLNTHTYFTIILIDLVCMLSIVMHRTILLARGLWYVSEEEILSQQERRRRREEELQREAAEAEEEDDQQPSADTVGKGTMSDAPPLDKLEQQQMKAAQAARDKAGKRSASPSSQPYVFRDGLEVEAEQRIAAAIDGPGKLDKGAETPADESEFDVTLRLLQQEEQTHEAEDIKGRGRDNKTVSALGKMRRRVMRAWYRYAPFEMQAYFSEIIPRERSVCASSQPFLCALLVCRIPSPSSLACVRFRPLLLSRFHLVNVHKPGYDWYLWIFLIELFSCVWILICYD